MSVWFRLNRVNGRLQWAKTAAEGKKEKLTAATTIGYKKIIDLQGIETDLLEIHIEDSRVAPVMSFVGVY